MRIGLVVDSRGLKGRLDLPALLDGLCGQVAAVQVVNGIHGEGLRDLVEANNLEGLVIASPHGDRVRAAAGEALHRAGADRFSVRVAYVHDLCAYVHPPEEATDKARSLLSAALAMLRHSRWLRPANVRLRFARPGERLSRRSLLSLPKLRYEVLPAVDPSRCVASRACNLCAAACPADAISFDAGGAYVQKERCRDCGLCLAACPVGAIDHPLYRRRVMDAGLSALLAPGRGPSGPRIVAFACPGAMDILRQAGRQSFGYPAAVVPLEVPCAGFVEWYLILRAFDLGAAAAAVLTCGQVCHKGHLQPATMDRLSALRRLLEAWSLGGVRLVVLTEDSAQGLTARLNDLAETVAALPRQPLSAGAPTSTELHRYRLARLVRAVAHRLGAADTFTLVDEHVPFGRAIIDSGRCSLCGLCADRCPTGALAYTEAQGKARLLFEAAECAGCRLCVEACPEAALRIERRLDVAPLQGGEQTLKSAEMVHCQRCGHPFAPTALLGRVLSRLGNSTSTAAGDYCPDCRMIAASRRPGH